MQPLSFLYNTYHVEMAATVHWSNMTTIELTLADLQKRLHQPWIVCYGIVETLHSAGLATRVGYQQSNGGKSGRPRIVWRVPISITLNLETGSVSETGGIV